MGITEQKLGRYISVPPIRDNVLEYCFDFVALSICYYDGYFNIDILRNHIEFFYIFQTYDCISMFRLNPRVLAPMQSLLVVLDRK